VEELAIEENGRKRNILSQVEELTCLPIPLHKGLGSLDARHAWINVATCLPEKQC